MFLQYDQRSAFLHIVELGNGFVTFQLRGMEFMGTFCHEQERLRVQEVEPNNHQGILGWKSLLWTRLATWQVMHGLYLLASHLVTLFFYS